MFGLLRNKLKRWPTSTLIKTMTSPRTHSEFSSNSQNCAKWLSRLALLSQPPGGTPMSVAWGGPPLCSSKQHGCGALVTSRHDKHHAHGRPCDVMLCFFPPGFPVVLSSLSLSLSLPLDNVVSHRKLRWAQTERSRESNAHRCESGTSPNAGPPQKNILQLRRGESPGKK